MKKTTRKKTTKTTRKRQLKTIRKNPSPNHINGFKVILDVNMKGLNRDEVRDELIDFLEFQLAKVAPFTEYSYKILD